MLALADAELRAGHLVEADRALQDGQKVLKLEPIWTSEILRLSGDVRMARNEGDWSAAEQLYEQALSVARSHNARSFELRAALSLARLRHRQGRVAEAQDLLRPICSWFTEGFQSEDLQAAQALLG
jgi:predicted ATPase